ncbi:acetyl-CoA carboxylase biotin carboxylase subunit [Rubrivirga sp. S365]|uniref:Biotin carboxylase n=1 Tax=Rubrivirga litoralis TaxID=3075598 RepID=A0ABU3BRW5_9BACT|nr:MULTISPECIES: acetyl-CoA carboxylase biotin carboxylase subunit [unclassified Rubrivirga]MDT0632029.1 acetyl-CoA carboxylase biotin carboxylase subunit [Rubrivirga sp. F394]MDT7855278.1 acetyl-CoA carboxylase biotin carboxylase subunit [Rubrivirga sp. S365]
MIKKVLIANRGEIALRIIRTCREMGIKTVAVYSTIDRDSLPVKFADEAVCIGPPPSAKSYLHIPSIIAAAEVTGADAVHPGYGFLAENAEFARVCDDHDLTFIGPRPETISKMGDKSVAKETMREAGVPVVPGSGGAVADVAEGLATAREAGFPVMIKASAGGGGRGMRMASNEAEFEKLFVAAGTEAANAFGDGRLYIEKFVEEPRHVEIQLVGDGQGTVVHFGERECSIQRRHQKLLEESPSPVVDADLRERMGRAAIDGALAVNYRGAGTVEFLLDKNRDFYFMEMNTRIQVEHPVTEEVTDTDLIEWQIRVASGETITSGDRAPRGHSIECRINAEDPFRNFSPSPGTITAFHSPKGRGVRCDTHVFAGYTVPPTYDSLIAKLIVREDTRERAIRKMLRALDEFIIEGLHTTVPFHQQLLQDPRFLAGDFDTKFLERFELVKEG